MTVDYGMQYHVNLGNEPGLKCLVSANIRERTEALNAALTDRGGYGDSVRVKLAAYGALSLLATLGQALVPGDVLELLRYAALARDEIMLDETLIDPSEG